MVGRRTCDQEVTNSIPGQGATAYDDSGQVVHTRLSRRWHSPLVRVFTLGTFTFFNNICPFFLWFCETVLPGLPSAFWPRYKSLVYSVVLSICTSHFSVVNDIKNDNKNSCTVTTIHVQGGPKKWGHNFLRLLVVWWPGVHERTTFLLVSLPNNYLLNFFTD